MISSSLKKIYSEIHRTTPFGKRGKVPIFLKEFIQDNRPTSILDFGCGKGNLIKTLKEEYPQISIYGYDPANPEFDIAIPDVDMIISTDVLEHIEVEHIDSIVSLLYDKAPYQYHLISCAPAKLILPDGRNAHLIQESPSWWRDTFCRADFCIVKEEYREFTKYSKQLRKELLVKNYYIMAKRNGIS